MRTFQQGSAPKILRIKGGGRNEVLWQMRRRGRGDADLQRGGMGLSQRAVRVQRHCLGARWEGMSSQFREAPQAPSGGKYYYEKIFGGSEWLDYPLNTLYYAFRDDGCFWEVEGQVDDRSSSYADVLYYCGCSLLRRSPLRTPSVRDDEQRVSESELVWARCQYRAGKDLSRVARYDRLARSPRRAAVSAAAS